MIGLKSHPWKDNCLRLWTDRDYDEYFITGCSIDYQGKVIQPHETYSINFYPVSEKAREVITSVLNDRIFSSGIFNINGYIGPNFPVTKGWVESMVKELRERGLNIECWIGNCSLIL